jgi:hypothetical protein
MGWLFARMKYLIIPASIFVTAASEVAAESVEFNRDIRPILTHHCTACHGGVKQAGGVSFIFRESALAAAESGLPPIVPGNPAKSEILRRIRSSDPDEVMPQPKHGPPLSAAEASLIERWIAEGAKWQKHWSHEAPVEPVSPKISDETWPAFPLDRFVMARLDREKLRPSPEAPAAEWLRRASFDLTGLPPTHEELAAFESAYAADPAAARGQVVDRLLASPRYGERWAAMWLDLARYADTYGFEKDPHRNIWPWRDWVIRAFNSDMPFDQFTIEQLAGDLLPNATADQRLATAFHRNTQCNTEGGTDDEEFRVAAVIDRVSTTWTTWQATTFGCVQCHSHPYDPIDHREFYQFTAFFDNTLDCDQDDDFPLMKIANDPAQRDELSDLETRIRDTRLRINRSGKEVANATADWQVFIPDAFAPSHGTLAVDADGTIRSQGTLPGGCQHEVAGAAPAFTALRLEIVPDSNDPLKWPERGSLVTKLDVRLIDAAGNSVPVPLKDIVADHLDGPHDPAPGGNFGGFPKLEGPRWFVIVPAAPVTPQPGSRLAITLKYGAQTTGDQATPVRNFRIDVSNNPGWTALAADPGRAGLWESLAGLKNQQAAIPGTPVPVMVERHDDARRDTRVFARGNRLTKDEAVQPGIPAIFQSPATAKPKDRLEMARWLVSKDNPLTARVMANRLWGELFGTGIVRTMEDFGTSGEVPSHPELLDHLALRLRDHHRWSVKALLREIVLSSTYRQSHKAAPELVARDRDNRLLARGPRVRLTAEMVRDQALAASGLLSAKTHGPPVYPPQPAGVWNSVYSGAQWQESTGEDRFRRGIYTYSKRTSGFPGFITFDAPSRDLCSARRITSNTPLQALVTLNDPAHIEAAQALAKRMEAHHPEMRERIAFGIKLATQQTASTKVVDELLALHADARAAYLETSDESLKLGPTPEAAALVLVANTLLNLDSALNR